jgi:N-hydroxyarylamine O-acetyltransferase
LICVMLEVNPYLERINYGDSTAATLDTLRAIHHAHWLGVPFENPDIARGRKIVLDQESLIRKIVHERRGSFCYELNGAFAALLRALDFSATLPSARVARDEGGEGPEFDHLCLRVDLDEPWLADVGFGESFLEPLRLQTNVEQADPAGPIDCSSKKQSWTAAGGGNTHSRCNRAVCTSSRACATISRLLQSRLSRETGSAPGQPTMGELRWLI